MTLAGHERTHHVADEVWDRPDMQAALAIRDIGRVYRPLQRLGHSQNTIGTLTGQSQPEVWGIIHGRRVQSYDVLLRIADGLGVPQGNTGAERTEIITGDDRTPFWRGWS
ncbi:MAG: helix-turn-helix transcriptional regulator [Actinobacteria bacterium]|nr:helix-turn-helix transcriptional regulator [Actinomycetota bacterium]